VEARRGAGRWVGGAGGAPALICCAEELP